MYANALLPLREEPHASSNFNDLHSRSRLDNQSHVRNGVAAVTLARGRCAAVALICAAASAAAGGGGPENWTAAVAAARVAHALARSAELPVGTEEEDHDERDQVRPPRFRDLVDPVAMGVLIAEPLQIRAARILAGKIANAPDEHVGADERGREDDHGLLDLPREQSADEPQYDDQDHEHRIRLARVQLVHKRRVKREREQRAGQRADEEEPDVVHHEHQAAADRAAHEEPDPGRQRDPRHRRERVFDDEGHEQPTGEEAADEDRRTQQAIPKEAHDRTDDHRADGRDPRSEPHATGRVEHRAGVHFLDREHAAGPQQYQEQQQREPREGGAQRIERMAEGVLLRLVKLEDLGARELGERHCSGVLGSLPLLWLVWPCRLRATSCFGFGSCEQSRLSMAGR